MTAHDTALKFALLKVLSSRLAVTKKTADEQIRTGWKVKDRNAAVLPDGTEIGAVTLAKGKSSARLTDEDAFMEWVLETHPDAVEQIQVTRVNPDFTDRLLAFARNTGSAIDPATGECVPGVQVVEGDPYATTRLEANADDLVAKAWQDGSLSELIGSLVHPPVEAGEV